MRKLLASLLALACAFAACGMRPVNNVPGITTPDAGTSYAPTAPSALPNYYFGYLPSGIVNSSGSVATWNDSGPHANNLVSSGAQEPAYTASAVNGYAGVTATFSTPSYMQSASTFAFASNQMTVFFVANIATPGTEYVLFESTANAHANNGFGFLAWYQNIGIVENATIPNSGMSIVPSTYRVMAMQIDRPKTVGNSISAWHGRNHVSEIDTASSTVFQTDFLNVFARAGSPPTNGITATLVELEGNNTALTGLQVLEGIDYLSTKYAIDATVPTRALFVFGDSISSTWSGNQFSTWASDIYTSGSYPHTAVNDVAYPGRTLASAGGSSGDPTEWAYNYPGVTTDAIVFAGTNDFANSTSLTPASMYATLQSYVTWLYSKGARHVGVVTMLPRDGIFSGGQTYAGFEADREGTGSYNALIRAGASGTPSYTVIDVGADSTLGCPTCCDSATYYWPDHVHPQLVGQNLIYSSYIAPTLTAWN